VRIAFAEAGVAIEHEGPLLFAVVAAEPVAIGVDQCDVVGNIGGGALEVIDHPASEIVEQDDAPLVALLVEHRHAEAHHRFQRVLDPPALDVQIQR
jgi:hypothetical protein